MSFFDSLAFDSPAALLWTAPLALAGLAASAYLLRRRNLPGRRVALLVALRAVALGVLVILLTRPVAVRSHDPEERDRVTVLLDRSKSMSLVEDGESRFERLLGVAEGQLIPALKRRGLETDAYLFAEGAYPADNPARRAAIADGPASDLGGALVHVLKSAPKPPLAVVVLSDGVANVSASNRSALVGLVDSGTPFVGLGVGDDEGVMSLSLERLTAPGTVAPEETFRVAAQIQAVGSGEVPAFDLVLLRNGELADVRHVAASHGSRLWSESFELQEDEEGLYEYTVELQAGESDDLVTVSRRASTPVKVSEERTFRVLFVQGALTWNFKFIGRALRGDPGLVLTGLSRTSEKSIFRQNVESAGELLDGFPDELAELAPYRVVILSDLGPADLTPQQQEVIARFVGELGGGLLMIGGVATFNASWQGSRLESLLPVRFETDPGLVALDRPFHLQLAEEALRHPAFQLEASASKNRAAWEALPTFTQYGRVREAKPGAVVWARHAQDSGPAGRRILMASQYYGAGLSSVIALQNLWRWRLAKDSDPAHFDRFLKQLLRFLGQTSGETLSVQFLDQDRGPGNDVKALVERRPRPGGRRSGTGEDDAGIAYTVRVEDPARTTVLEQSLELRPLRPVEIGFRTEEEGIYLVKVFDASDVQVLSRSLEVKSVDREMERTGRDLENLRQWASLTQGLALPIEECRDMEEIVDSIESHAAALQRVREERVPLGVNGWVLWLLVAALGGEWALRKRWNLS